MVCEVTLFLLVFSLSVLERADKKGCQEETDKEDGTGIVDRAHRVDRTDREDARSRLEKTDWLDRADEVANMDRLRQVG